MNKEITQNGLWTNNVALVQLLGLCPLLAVTSTTINGVGLGLGDNGHTHFIKHGSYR